MSSVRMTDSGALVASVRCARVGIQDYAGFELGHPDRERIRVLRPESAVFDKRSMATYAHRPVCNDHPAEAIDPTNWREHAIGHLGESVARDGDYIRVSMMLADAKAIADVQRGKVELSAGYTASLELFDEPRKTEYGIADGQMVGFAANHVALVDRGRAGPSCAIGANDSATPQPWGATPITTTDGADTPDTTDGAPASSFIAADRSTTTEDARMVTRTIVVDGLQVESTDAGIAAIEKLQKDVREAKDAAAAAQTRHEADAQTRTEAQDKAVADAIAEKDKLVDAKDAALDAKDAELAAKDAEIAELKGKVLDDAAMDAAVAKRSALITKATLLAKDADFSGKSEREIKAIAVDAAHGKGTADGKSDAYLDAAFDLAKVPEGTGDKVRDTLIAGVKPVGDADTASDHGYSVMTAQISNDWKGEAA